MKIEYNELITEVNELTTIEGFIATCLDLKDSMLFYDRDLVLAAYGATLELLVVATLFCGSLESNEVVLEVEQQLDERVSNLIKTIVNAGAPIDVQNMGEYFAKGSGWVLLQRYPVYKEMFRIYRRNDYHDTPDVDQLLRDVQLFLQQGALDQAIQGMALVGVKVLRGAHLRPIWFKIGHHRLQVWLSGLQTIVNNFSVAAYFTFPFGDITTEMQKRTKVSGNVVVDFGAFRNFRRGLGGYTDRRILIEPDDLDKVLERFWDTRSLEFMQATEHDQQLITALYPLLMAIGEARLIHEDLDSKLVDAVLSFLMQRDYSHVADLALRLIQVVDPWDPLFHSCLVVLRGLGLKAIPAIRRFVRQRGSSSLYTVIADVLAGGKKSKRVFSILAEIFHRSEWGKGKEMVCFALARYGGEEAKAVLEQARLDLPAKTQESYGKQVEEALKMIG